MQIKFHANYDYLTDDKNNIQVKLQGNITDFNEKLLNIGNLRAASKPIEVLAVIFDLEGFTQFSSQVDPQVTLPDFIADFFNWLFKTIKEVLNAQEDIFWAELPFFTKFLGDGVLLLWRLDIDKIVKIKKLEEEKLGEKLNEYICNIIATMYDICKKYNDLFNDNLNKNYCSPPNKLRCGIARGNVFPIGIDKDFVGPCINIASRLQKFLNFSFAFSGRGINGAGFESDYEQDFVKIKTSIRGIGGNEIIYVLKEDYEEHLKKIVSISII